jgi:hypothetical protein
MAPSISVSIRGSERQRATCCYCHEELSDPIRLCMACHTSLHEDCYHELGRCPTLGCVASGVWRAEDQQPAPAINAPLHAPVDDLSPPLPTGPGPTLSIFARFVVLVKLLFALPLTAIAWIWTGLWVFVSFFGIIATIATSFHDPSEWFFVLFIIILNILFSVITLHLTRWTRSLLREL